VNRVDISLVSKLQKAGDHGFEWKNLHNGRGSILVHRYFEGAFKWPIELEIWEISVGGSEGIHRHDATDPDGYAWVDECYVVIEGIGRFTIGDAVVEVGPGDAVLARPTTDRGVENTGTIPLRMIVVSDLPKEIP
jgi:oxalate decarboxylase/phosphoglucose isomerase-like protein (cupin superfamily)